METNRLLHERGHSSSPATSDPLLSGPPESSSALNRNHVPLGISQATTEILSHDIATHRPHAPKQRPGYTNEPLPATTRRQGPQRTSYTTQKLKLLPDEPLPDDDSGRDVYSQVTRIKDRPARKDAERLGKAHRSMLPRVTAYCTAGSYRINELSRYVSGRKAHHGAPKLFDECLYTPYKYRRDMGTSDDSKLMRLDDEGGEIDFSYTDRSEMFLFDYGVVVFWGFTETEEKRFLKELAKFEAEKLADEDVQIEEFNYYITKSYQPRIYNDFITLRDNTNYMIKLSISHAIAQSVKISLFEELVDNTIDATQDFPQEIALTGKINMNRKNIIKSIGELFILRININLHGSILDSPELMWAEPHLEPIYQATRGYLEINQRVSLLNTRLEVISDLLQMLKEQLGHAHGKYRFD
jgi:uncharacterized Rmd1/YagE family protein